MVVIVLAWYIVVEPIKLWIWSFTTASTYGPTVIVSHTISGVVSNATDIGLHKQEPAAATAAAACSVWSNASPAKYHHGVVSHFIPHVHLHQATQSKHSLWYIKSKFLCQITVAYKMLWSMWLKHWFWFLGTIQKNMAPGSLQFGQQMNNTSLQPSQMSFIQYDPSTLFGNLTQPAQNVNNSQILNSHVVQQRYFLLICQIGVWDD